MKILWIELIRINCQSKYANDRFVVDNLWEIKGSCGQHVKSGDTPSILTSMI